MRLFRKKSDSSDHQEYLDGLITSIRQARRAEEEKPDLQAFIEEDQFPVSQSPGGLRAAPNGPAAPGEVQPEPEEAEEIANLEAYLSQLEAVEHDDEDEPEDKDEQLA